MALKRVGLAFTAEEGEAFIRVLNRIDAAGDDLNKGLKKNAGAIDRSFADISRGAKERIGHVVADSFFSAASAVGDFLAGSLDAAGKFEAGMNRFASVTGSGLAESGRSLEQYSALFLQMGADTQFSSQQAADAAIELAKGGRSAGQVYKELSDSLTLASAGELSLASAAEISAKQMAIWEDTGVRSKDVANLLAQAANASTVGVEDLGVGLAQVGGVAKIAGLSFEETVQTLAQIAPGFSSASDAGTSFKAFLNNLQPTTKPAIKAMQELNLLAEDGTSLFYDAAGSFIGMEKASELLHTSTAGLTEAQRSLKLETIFGSDAQRAAAIIAEDGAAGYLKMGESMGKAGTAADQAAEKNKGYAFQLETLKGSLETFQITLGGLLIGPATDFLVWITDAVNGLGALVEWFGKSSDSASNTGVTIGDVFAGIAQAIAPATVQGAAMRAELKRINEEAKKADGMPALIDVFGRLTSAVAPLTNKMRQMSIATGELGRAGTLSKEELEALNKELLKIEDQGSKAVLDGIETITGYLTDSEERRKTHLETLKKLNESYRLAETADEQNAIALKISEEQTAYATSQFNADVAFAKQSAAQRAHLGEMLISWTTTQVAMGDVTNEQAEVINQSIATQFGVAADNTALLFGQMTGSIMKFAESGSADVDGMSTSLLGLQNEAANTQLKINRMTDESLARLDQEFKDGKITIEEYRKRLVEIPGEVRTKVLITGAAEAQTDAIAMGYAIAGGLAQGVRNGKSQVSSAVVETIGAAYAAGRAAAQISSPSRLFERGIGKPMPDGMVRGIDDGMPAVGGALVKGIQDAEILALTAARNLNASLGQELAKGPIGGKPADWTWNPTGALGKNSLGAPTLTGGAERSTMPVGDRVSPPASANQINQRSNNQTNYTTANYNYAPTYASAPNTPSQDFALMAARDPIM